MHAFVNSATGPAVEVARAREDENKPTAEQVARVVAGIPVIGEACNALRKAGWRATIAGNRITVNDDLFARLIGATVNPSGAADASWVIHRIAGTPPVWIVGAGPSTMTPPSSDSNEQVAARHCAREESRSHSVGGK